mmetsp:Transcript_21126/g.23584  ORF Transcript_21126/g.23584 Transcript_21126/m.23584 type:complete len:307 (+) Transcript_21126:1120-2040(+)
MEWVGYTLLIKEKLKTLRQIIIIFREEIISILECKITLVLKVIKGETISLLAVVVNLCSLVKLKITIATDKDTSTTKIMRRITTNRTEIFNNKIKIKVDSTMEIIKEVVDFLVVVDKVMLLVTTIGIILEETKVTKDVEEATKGSKEEIKIITTTAVVFNKEKIKVITVTTVEVDLKVAGLIIITIVKEADLGNQDLTTKITLIMASFKVIKTEVDTIIIMAVVIVKVLVVIIITIEVVIIITRGSKEVKITEEVIIMADKEEASITITEEVFKVRNHGKDVNSFVDHVDVDLERDVVIKRHQTLE